MSEEKALLKTELLGLSYTCLEKSALVSLLARLAKEGRFTAVFTPNAVIAAEAEKSEALKAILQKADFLLADGIGVTLASRLSFSPVPPRLTGIDTAEALLPLLEREGLRLFLYGGKEGVALAAREAILSKHPRLAIGTHDGYSPGAEEAISRFSPHVLFVCLGFPRQERFILSLREGFDGVAMGLGGCLDAWAGQAMRAPRVLRRFGLEWLWRTLCEPHRARRLLPLPRFFWRATLAGGRKLIQKSQKRGYRI